MVQLSRFWDGTTLGDATVAPYDAGTEFAEVMIALGGAANTADRGGVIKNLQGNLSISSPSAGVVRVGPGEALVYGTWYKSDANVDHTFAAPAAAARTDRIVLRKSWSAQTVRQIIILGAEGGSVPVITQVVGDTWDIPIAQVAVATNGTITITDQRTELGIPPTDLILTDPTIRDTLFFGAKPSGIGDARITRISANHLAAPNEIFTVGISQVDGPLSQERSIKFLTGGVMRWQLGLGANATEPGGNVGSDLGLYRYADNGSYINWALIVSRANGSVSFQGSPNITAPGILTIQPAGAIQLNPQSGGSVVVSPSSLYMHPGADIQYSLGHPSYRWSVIYANSLTVSSNISYGGLFGGEHQLQTGVRLIWWNAANTAWYAFYYSGDGYFRQQFSGGNTAFAIDTNGNIYTNIVNSGTQVNTPAINSGGNISLTPAAGYVHPDANNVRYLGHPSLNWLGIYVSNINSPGQFTLQTPANYPIVQQATGIYLRSTNIINVDTGASPLNYFAPEYDNKSVCGNVSGGRWVYIAAVNGGINTCWEHEKEIVDTLDPQDALDAVLATPLFLFHPKNFEGTVDKEMLFAGPVNTSVDPRLQIGKGAVTAAGHQAVYAMASVQKLHARLEELEREVAWLKSR